MAVPYIMILTYFNYPESFITITGFILERALAPLAHIFLQMAHRKSDEGADPARKFSGKNLLGSEFIPHKNVGIHIPSTA